MNDRGRTQTQWWRFTRYKVEDDIIQPHENAELVVYDPWETFSRIEGVYRTVEPAYLELFRLAQKFEKVDRDANRDIETRFFEIPRFCARHGLLGILPATYTMIRLPIKRRKVDRSQPVHRRLGGRWKTFERGLEDPLPRKERDPATWSVDWYAGHDWAENDYFLRVREGKLTDEEFTAFFPGLPAEVTSKGDYPYPLPCSPGFWALYGERIRNFRGWAQRLLKCAETLSTYADSLQGREPLESEAPENVLFAWQQLNDIQSAAGRLFSLDGNFTEENASPALVATYALMILRDLQAGRRIRRCENCGLVFVSDDARASYCSPKCRHAAQQRRYRARSKSDSPPSSTPEKSALKKAGSKRARKEAAARPKG